MSWKIPLMNGPTSSHCVNSRIPAPTTAPMASAIPANTGSDTADRIAMPAASAPTAAPTARNAGPIKASACISRGCSRMKSITPRSIGSSCSTACRIIGASTSPKETPISLIWLRKNINRLSRVPNRSAASVASALFSLMALLARSIAPENISEAWPARRRVSPTRIASRSRTSRIACTFSPLFIASPRPPMNVVIASSGDAA